MKFSVIALFLYSLFSEIKWMKSQVLCPFVWDMCVFFAQPNIFGQVPCFKIKEDITKHGLDEIKTPLCFQAT